MYHKLCRFRKAKPYTLLLYNTHKCFSVKKLEIILYIFTDLFAKTWSRNDVCLLSAFLLDEECVVPTYKCTMDMNSRLTDSVFPSLPKIKLKSIIFAR